MSKKQVAFYILDKKIGKGSYATVWKGRVDGANPEDTVAVKVISRQTVTETYQLRHEVNVLRRISHDNIVRFRDLKKSAAHFYLVLEYCAGGDLSQFLTDRGRVSEGIARRFLTQIAAGLCVLHRENVLHRDLKPQNILLSDRSEDPVLKIADFGFARALQPQDMAATVCGSPLYMAPEILRHEPYDARADLWSVGAILYELLLGRTPFSGANPMQLLANIEKDDRLFFEGVDVSSEGQEFLRALLRRCPKERLSSQEFMRHAYVRLTGAKATPPVAPAVEASARRGGGAIDDFCIPDAESKDLEDDPEQCEWCVPPDVQDPGTKSPSSAASSSPVPSPLTCRSPASGSPRGASSFHLNCEVSPKATANAVREAEELFKDAAPASAAAGAGPAVSHRGAGADPSGSGRRGGARRVEDEYVVLTAQQPGAAFARGRGPTPRAAASSFCGNLSRIAHALEHLALRLQDESPLECLALLIRALGLLEKALNVSLAEEETHEQLRKSFNRIMEAAEKAGKQVRASTQRTCATESLHPPARPNAAIFDHAVQQARDAAVALSKGHETGGWEAPVREKLSLALLLLDLLGTEADGDDAAAISSYTAPISRLLSEIESRSCPMPPAPALLVGLGQPQPVIAGC